MEVNIIILITSVAGFLVANNIRSKKKKSTKIHPFVCPLNFNCHDVVTSNYAKFFGMPFDILGMIYYSFIIISYVGFIIHPELKSEQLIYFIIGTSFFAFLISTYLTFVQAFRLREWCSWCLFSNILCTIIFLSAFISVLEIVNTIIIF